MLLIDDTFRRRHRRIQPIMERTKLKRRPPFTSKDRERRSGGLPGLFAGPRPVVRVLERGKVDVREVIMCFEFLGAGAFLVVAVEHLFRVELVKKKKGVV